MSSKDSKPPPSVTENSLAEGLSTASDPNVAEDLIPSAAEQEQRDSKKFLNALSEVGGMLHGMSRNFEEANGDVLTLKRKLSVMEAEHKRIVEYVDSLKDEYLGKKPKLEEEESSTSEPSGTIHKPTVAITESDDNVANTLMTGGPSFQEFPPVQSAKQRLPRSSRPHSPIFPMKVDTSVSESRTFRRSSIQLYSQCIDPSGRYIPQQPSVNLSGEGPSTSNSTRNTGGRYSDSFGATKTFKLARAKSTPPHGGYKRKSQDNVAPLKELSKLPCPARTSDAAASTIDQVKETIVDEPAVSANEKSTSKSSTVMESISEELDFEEGTSEDPTANEEITEGEKSVFEELEVEEQIGAEELAEEQVAEEHIAEEQNAEGLNGDEPSLQEGPSSSSTTKKPSAEKKSRLTKQQVKANKESKIEAQKKKEEAEQAKQEELASIRTSIHQAMMAYFKRSDVARKNLVYDALDKKICDKFLADRLETHRKAKDDIMSFLYILFQENYHPCIAQDMYILHQKRSSLSSQDEFIEFEKMYYRIVSGKLHPDIAISPEKSTDSKVAEFLDVFFGTLLHPKRLGLHQLPGESIEQALERMVGRYLEEQSVLRKMPLESFDQESMNDAQFTLIKQHHLFINSPLKWEAVKAKEFFLQRAADMRGKDTESSRLLGQILTFLSTKVNDILVIDAMCLNQAHLYPNKFDNFRTKYFMLII